MMRFSAVILGLAWMGLSTSVWADENSRARLDALVATYAAANGVPESLVHRVIVRESRYNPRAVGRGGAMGLMQIKYATARGLGYSGSPSGLLDPETNLNYAVRYLAGAYRVAGGNHNRAVSYFARGYYYAAKRKGLTATASARLAPH
jgi:soluble lytic murein transglycosylase-like protein